MGVRLDHSTSDESDATPKARRCLFVLVFCLLLVPACLFGIVGESREVDVSIGSVETKQNHDDESPYVRCMNRVFFRKLPALIAKLNENPEATALQPVSITYNDTRNNETTEIVSGLDLSAFLGRRIAFMGDSTLFYPTKWLYHFLMDPDGWDKFVSANKENLTMSHGQTFVFEKAPFLDPRRNDGRRYRTPDPIVRPGDGTRIEWMGMAGPATFDLEEKLESMIDRAKALRPQVIVANLGMHWFQFCGSVRGTERCPKDARVVNRFIWYEEWLQSVLDTALEVNATLVLFKTTNFISQATRTGNFALWDEQYQGFDNETLRICGERIQALYNSSTTTSTKNVTTAQIEEYCRTSQFTELGAMHLNHRIETFVRAYYNEKNLLESSPLTVAIFNDHDLESDESTNDGVHHPNNMVMRLRFLANTIKSYQECMAIRRRGNRTNEY